MKKLTKNPSFKAMGLMSKSLGAKYKVYVNIEFSARIYQSGAIENTFSVYLTEISGSPFYQADLTWEQLEDEYIKLMEAE